MKEEESGLDIPEEEELLEKGFFLHNILEVDFKIHITMTRVIFYTLKKQERRSENLVKESNNVQEKTAGSFLNNRPEQSGEVIDLLELFWELVKHWKHILLAMLIGAVLAGVYYLVGVKPSYQADASIFITNNESVITVSDLQLSSELTEDYAKIIKSRNVLKQVIKDLDLNLDYRALSRLVFRYKPG